MSLRIGRLVKTEEQRFTFRSEALPVYDELLTFCRKYKILFICLQYFFISYIFFFNPPHAK